MQQLAGTSAILQFLAHAARSIDIAAAAFAVFAASSLPSSTTLTSCAGPMIFRDECSSIWLAALAEALSGWSCMRCAGAP